MSCEVYFALDRRVYLNNVLKKTQLPDRAEIKYSKVVCCRRKTWRLILFTKPI